VIDWSKYPAPPRAPGSYQVRNLPPIVGKLRRQILLDISVAFGVGMTMAYLFWYGYHVPAVRRRDIFYEKLEEEKIRKFGGIPFSFSTFSFLIVFFVCGSGYRY
jgi:cytochrome c oxidase subunit 7